MRVLIVRVGALGDVLHALPAVAALRIARADWKIDWVVDPRWAALLVDGEGHGEIVDHAQLAETKMWSASPLSWKTLRSVAALRRELRREHYDVVVDVQGTMRSAVIGRFARAREFTGYEDPREAAAARLYRTTQPRIGTHIVEQNTALVSGACGVALEPAPVGLPHTGWADEWAAELVGDRKVCVLAASAGWGAKQWPAERYGALAKELRAMGFVPLVNAPKKDDAVAASVVASSGGAAEMVVCNVAGMIALMRRASLLVGGDSGPTHLAAALGIPLVALYGPTDPARNGPWGSGPMRVLRGAGSVTSHKRVAEIDAGLARMGVDEVIGAVRSVTAPE
ncbi:MAG TPA: glycosyltransferase family 9 protein [Candidatus Aquilonibacter sp.]|nr:glycosyltransferase family 9 protein [Candidatus Aquilonibacter sp.]